MKPDDTPRPERWLVAPESLFRRLRGSEQSAGGLRGLRFDSGHVESASTETLIERIGALLDEDWSRVRLILGEDAGEWRDAVDQALGRIADALGPVELARLRIHEHASQPAETDATLGTPDEAILQRWLESGRPPRPALGGREIDAIWIERYRNAFDDWLRAVVYHYGDGAFAWFDEQADSPSAARVEPARGEWHDLAANDEEFAPRRRAGGGRPSRRVRGAVDDAAASTLLARWTARIRGVDIAIEAYGYERPGAGVELRVRADASAAARVPVRTVELIDPSDLVIGRASVVWNDEPGSDGRALATAAIVDDDDALLIAIRWGDVRARLEIVAPA